MMSQVLLPIASPRETAQTILSIFRQHQVRVMIMLLFHGIAVGFTILSPVLFGKLLDVVTGESSRPVLVIFVGICAALLARTLFTWLAQRASFGFGEKVYAQLRDEVITGIVGLPLQTVETVPRGDVLSRTSNDIDAVSEGVRIGLPEVLVGLLSVAFTMTVSFILDWRIALASLVGLPLLILSTRWYVRRSQSAYSDELVNHAKYDSAVLETINGQRTIDTHRMQDEAVAKINTSAQGVFEAEKYTLRLQTAWFPIGQLGYYLPFAVTAVVGGILAIQGEASIGTVVAIALNILIIIDPLDDLIYWTDQLQLAAIAFQRIVGVARPVSTLEETQRSSSTVGGAQIDFKQVYFGYTNDQPSFEDLTLTIAPGQRVVLVGQSGAGKSTLALLAAGVYVPDRGLIDIHGENIQTLTENELRRRIVIVTQEQHIFHGSLADNLRLAAPDANDEQLKGVLTAVGADELIGGLGGNIHAELDVNIDIVDMQRIALARVILRDPQIVILDEATSALSLEEESKLELALYSALKDRTVITIAHRLQNVARADRIIVMDNGEIVQDGTHMELMDQAGTYASLWNAWSPDIELSNDYNDGVSTS